MATPPSISLDSATQNLVNQAFLNLHYAIAVNRPIFIAYGQNQQTLISDNPNYNAYFQNGGGSSDGATTVVTQTTGMFLARVYEVDIDLDPTRPLNSQVLSPYGTIQLTTDITGKTLLDGAIGANGRITFNGKVYRASTTDSNYGLLNRPFYDYKLAPTA